MDLSQPSDETGRTTEETTSSNRPGWRPGRPFSSEVTRYQRDHWDDQKVICHGESIIERDGNSAVGSSDHGSDD